MTRITIYLDLTQSNMNILDNTAQRIQTQLAHEYPGAENVWYDRHRYKQKIPLLQSDDFKRTDLLYLVFNEITELPFTIKSKSITRDGREMRLIYANLDVDFLQLENDQMTEFETVSHDLNLVMFSPGYGATPVIYPDNSSNFLRINPRCLMFSKSSSKTFHAARAAVWDVAQAVREGRGTLSTYTTFCDQEHLIFVVDPIERFEARGRALTSEERTRFIKKSHRAPEFLKSNYRRGQKDDRYDYQPERRGRHHQYDTPARYYENYYNETREYDDYVDTDEEVAQSLDKECKSKIPERPVPDFGKKRESRRDSIQRRDTKEMTPAVATKRRERRHSSVPATLHKQCLQDVKEWTLADRESRKPKSEVVKKECEEIKPDLERLMINKIIDLQMQKMGMGRINFRGNSRSQISPWANQGGPGGQRGSPNRGRGRGAIPRTSRASPYPEGRPQKWDKRSQGAQRQEENAQLPDVDWEKITQELGPEFTDYIMTLGAKTNRKTLFGARFRSPGLGYGFYDSKSSCYVEVMSWDPFSDPVSKDLDSSLATNSFETFHFRRVPDNMIGEANAVWKRMALANTRLREIVRVTTDQKTDLDSAEANQKCDDEIESLVKLGAGLGNGKLGERLTVHVMYQISSLCTLFEVFKAAMNQEALSDTQKVRLQYAYASISNSETFEAIKKHHLTRFHDGSGEPDDKGDGESEVSVHFSSSSEGEEKFQPSGPAKTKATKKGANIPTARQEQEDKMNETFQSVANYCSSHDNEIAAMDLEQLEKARYEQLGLYYKYSKENRDQAMIWQTEIMLQKFALQQANLERAKQGASNEDNNQPVTDQNEEAEMSETGGPRNTPGNKKYRKQRIIRGEGVYLRPCPWRTRFYPN